MCLVYSSLPKKDPLGSSNTWSTLVGSKVRFSDNQVQKGDIIFNYKASNSVHLRYPHVVIATGSYSAGKVPVHGHTENHKDWDKSINSTNCKCYRVVSGAPLEACEKLVTLPTTGSGATVN